MHYHKIYKYAVCFVCFVCVLFGPASGKWGRGRRGFWELVCTGCQLLFYMLCSFCVVWRTMYVCIGRFWAQSCNNPSPSSAASSHNGGARSGKWIFRIMHARAFRNEIHILCERGPLFDIFKASNRIICVEKQISWIHNNSNTNIKHEHTTDHGRAHESIVAIGACLGVANAELVFVLSLEYACSHTCRKGIRNML